MTSLTAIDFGTTTTLVATRTDDLAGVIPIGENRTTSEMPSICTLDKMSSTISVVGENSLAQIENNKNIVLRSIKRCLSCVSGECKNLDSAGVPCSLQSTLATQSNDHRNAIVIAAVKSIMSEAFQRAEVRLRRGALPRRLQIGCPVEFGYGERSVLAECASGFGSVVSVRNIIEESIAAARSYLIVQRQGASSGNRRILIVDVGGGSLDLAVLDVVVGAEARIEIVATGGDRLLGGDDFDDIICDDIIDQVAKKEKLQHSELVELIRSNPSDQFRLRQAAEEVKKDFGQSDRFSMTLAGGLLGGQTYFADSDVFEEKSRSLRVRIMRHVKRLLSECEYITLDSTDMARGVNPDFEAVDAVYCTGGGSRIRYIVRDLADAFGRTKVVVASNPTEAIVEGMLQVPIGGGDCFRVPYSITVREVGALVGWQHVVRRAYDELYPRWASVVRGVARGEWRIAIPAGVRMVEIVVKDVDNCVVWSDSFSVHGWSFKIGIPLATGELQVAQDRGWVTVWGGPPWQSSFQLRNRIARVTRDSHRPSPPRDRDLYA
jgi:molecular chaperone DnaK (HSP70)